MTREIATKMNRSVIGVINLLLLVLMSSFATSSYASEDEDAKYFTAYQLSQLYGVSSMLVPAGDEKVVGLIVDGLIQHHQQRNLIEEYEGDDEDKKIVRSYIAEAVQSSEFNSWLNEQISNAYMARYSYQELKDLYIAMSPDQKLRFLEKLNEYFMNAEQALHIRKEYEQKFWDELDKIAIEILNGSQPQ